MLYITSLASTLVNLTFLPVMGKSQIKSQVQIICKNDLNQNLKSKIKSQIIKLNPYHFWSKSNHKSILPKCQIFEMLVYIITIESRKNHNRFAYANNCFQIEEAERLDHILCVICHLIASCLHRYIVRCKCFLEHCSNILTSMLFPEMSIGGEDHVQFNRIV